jgi:redox-sensitive bicupin YhaK (pirin superfamily)
VKQKLRLIAARNPRNGAVKVNQDVELHVGRFGEGETSNYPLKPDRHAWIQVTRGTVSVNGTELRAGDGAAVSDEKALEIKATEPAELLLFDLA